MNPNLSISPKVFQESTTVARAESLRAMFWWRSSTLWECFPVRKSGQRKISKVWRSGSAAFSSGCSRARVAAAKQRPPITTHYHIQVPDCALFVGKQDWARKTMEEAKSKRIAAQIEADGRQSLELQRTKAFSYSCMNLRGLIELAQLGDVVGGDLWHYQSSDARSIRRAVDYLLPCATGEKKWEYKQLVGLDPTELTSGLLQASVGYGDAVYERAAETIGTKSGESVLRLAIRIRKEASPGGN